MVLQRHQQQQQQRKITSGSDASVKTVLGGAGADAGTGAGAGVGPTSTGDAGRQTRPQTTHAISNPVLADIEKRWDDMPPQEQANLWMSIRDRLKVDWHDLTLNEKKAGSYNILSLFFRRYLHSCSFLLYSAFARNYSNGSDVKFSAELGKNSICTIF